MQNFSFFDVHSHHMAYSKDKLINFIKDAARLDICVFFMAVDFKTYKYLLELAKVYKNIIPCFGIHPQNAYKYINRLEILDSYIKDALVVGEIGLDNFWSDEKTRLFQRDVFVHQLKTAQKYNKPLSIHTMGAEIETYEILKKYNCKNICIHWYHGDINILKKFISLGCYFSIGPDIGFSDNANIIEKTIPTDKILCETDGPDAVAWAQNTDISNNHYSAYAIIDVYEKLSNVLQIDKSILIMQIKQNVQNFLYP